MGRSPVASVGSDGEAGLTEDGLLRSMYLSCFAFERFAKTTCLPG